MGGQRFLAARGYFQRFTRLHRMCYLLLHAVAGSGNHAAYILPRPQLLHIQAMNSSERALVLKRLVKMGAPKDTDLINP